MNSISQTESEGVFKFSLGRLLAYLSELRVFSLSLFLHVILVAVLGSVVIFRGNDEKADFVSAEGDGLLVDPGTLPEDPAQMPEEPVKEFSTAAPQSADVSSAVEVITTARSSSSFNVAPAFNKSMMAGLGDAAGIGKGSGGTGLGAGMGMGGGVMRFFGTAVKAEHIVVVLDVSGSMISGGKSEKTYGELEKEVIRLVRSLEAKNSFGVVVFSRDAKVYRTHLVTATSDEKVRAVSWIKRQSPVALNNPREEEDERSFHHGTRADRGLQEAFKLGPDTIFFVSDGEPTGVTVPEVLSSVSEAQKGLKKAVAIHAVAYLADSGQQFMRELARVNGGTFREVNPSDVKGAK